MKKQIASWTLSALLVVLTAVPVAFGQSVMGFLANGGATTTDGQMTMFASVGQTATGESTDGTYTLMGGFWSGNISVATAVQPQTPTGLPTTFELDQNYPNPFNPTTTIRYSLPKAVNVRLDIYNILGQHVSTLVDGQQKAGYYQIHFLTDGLSSGVYLYRLQAGSHVIVRKMLFMK
ncbi:MAG TPA: T9SS type A sorting domain-containing protein [Balneolales bacterium]|nr:T9SS type A sorting domain-containing protein [Balneolales bacterium]